jgi:hypothetical protein
MSERSRECSGLEGREGGSCFGIVCQEAQLQYILYPHWMGRIAHSMSSEFLSHALGVDQSNPIQCQKGRQIKKFIAHRPLAFKSRVVKDRPMVWQCNGLTGNDTRWDKMGRSSGLNWPQHALTGTQNVQLRSNQAFKCLN